MTEKRFTLGIDIETYSSVDLAEAGVYRYTEDPFFDVMLVAYAFGDEDVHVIDLMTDGYPGKTETDRQFWKALTDPKVEKRAFNAVFERTCLAKYTGKEMPPEQWTDTMIQALVMGLPAGLGAVGEAMGLPKDEQKDKQGKTLIQYFCKPCRPTRTNGERTRNLPENAPEKWELFKEYNRQDVVAERAIAKKLEQIDRPYEPEHRLWCLDQNMNDNGIRLDVGMVEKIVEYDERRGAELLQEAKDITGLDNPNSVTQLKDWLNDQGVPFTSVTKETVAAALTLQYIPENVRRALEIRQALGKASVKKYAAMLNAVCEDGRLRGILQFYGANRTGRWAGRLVQVHNLAKNSLPDLDLARELAASGDFDTMQTLFGETSFVFSELVRTAFIASEGCRFVVSDFSAIEARVIAWLAGEQWVLDAFAAGEDIYCKTASMMYKVPVVKHGENGHLRAKGKISVLACGFGGGVGALKAMDSSGAVPEDEMQSVVNAWRDANPKIVKLWKSYELAAKKAIKERRTVKQPHGIEFSYHDSCLFVKLPSGRKLCYWGARVREDPATGRESICYMGVNQETKKWGEAETWGGKISENCIAKDTQVLTDSGWKAIQDITTDDMLWDGNAWVKHDGLINKGLQEVINVDGVLMTPDHMILTEEGWKHAKDTNGTGRPAVRLPDGYQLRRIRRTSESVENPVRLREGVHDARLGVEETEAEVLRVHEEEDHRREEQKARDVEDADLRGLAFHEGEMRVPDGASVEELRRTRDQGLREVVEELRSVPGGHGPDISEGADVGQDRRQRRLHTGELQVDHDERAVKEQTNQQAHQHTMGTDNRLGSVGEVRHRGDDAALPIRPWRAGVFTVHEAGLQKQVYDLKNAGPEHRFTVAGINGPIIVHNCTQAVARDCLAEAMQRVTAAGYNIVMHVHDEMIVDAPNERTDAAAEITELMSRTPDWAEGLPLKGETYETAFYKKD